MIIGLSSSRAHTLSQEFVQGEVKKEYIARCSGEFPAEEVVVDQPLLTVDRQMGLNIVHPEGKVRMRRHSKRPSMTDIACEACKNHIHPFALRQKHEHERAPLYVIVF
jgi:23S rRNA-/tRNA-specific pseudouridylate synthase